jgi:two-component system, NarL family, sensor histidine kinase UhpB
LKKGIVVLIVLICATTAFAQSSVIDSLQRIVALQRHDTTELKTLLNLTFEFSRKDLEKAITSAHQSLALARALSNPVHVASSYFYLVLIYQNSGKLDSALYYLGLSEALLHTAHPNVKIEINYNQTAGLFYKSQGQYRKALPYMLDNLRLMKTENEGRAGNFLNIGNAYFSLSDYKNAVSYHLQALSLFERVKSKRGRSFCLQNLGNDFLNLGQFEKSKEYFLQSRELKEEIQDKRGGITSSTGLGDSYKGLGEFAIAEKYYNDAIKISREMKLVLDEARAQFQLGLLEKVIGDRVHARENIVQSLALARMGGDSILSAKINSERIGLDVMERQERGMESTLLNNLNTLINSGDKSGERREYSRLSQYYDDQNKFDKAYYYLKKHDQLKDSVESSSVLMQMKQLEEQFQSEKHQKEIELLKKDQELQALALSRERTNVILIAIALASVIVISILLINRNRVVSRARREIEIEKVRNHIARDLHDDIGSTLSSIHIISELAQTGDPARHLKQITLHSSKMMENMSDIVWSINPKNDSMAQVILKMKEFAVEILEPKAIAHSFEIDDTVMHSKLTVEKRKNLFLIFKEAVNNAAKYSGGQTVLITLSVKVKTFHFSIQDNGAGFVMDEIRPGNGLINMKERADAIGGKLLQSSQPGQGTRLDLEIPIT